MVHNFIAPYLGAALQKFKKIISDHAEKEGREGKKLVVLCEDRLSLVAERAVCEEVGGTFAVSVYTLSRFLSAESGRCDDVLTSQGSAMAISRLIEKNRANLHLFNRLSTAGAAQEVYDTLALLYSSKISPDDLAGVETENNLLMRKLHDLELLYREYVSYLRDCGAVDRNAYLRRLPDVIRSSYKIMGADVVILGFQAFTSSVADAVKACIDTADNVYGVFIGGNQSKYVNEAWAKFESIASECGEKVERVRIPSTLIPTAEQLRKYVFEPESYYTAPTIDAPRSQINLVKCLDEDEECELFAATAIKCVKEDGVRYRDISVMLPDLNGYQPVLERVFEEYGVPYYVDRRYPLSSHSVCEFIISFLNCVADGCRQESVIAAVSSPLFVFESKNVREDKDHFINYVLRAISSRGGVKKAINPDICRGEHINYDSVERVRTAFFNAYNALPTNKSDGHELCGGIRELLKNFGAEDRLKELAKEAEEAGFASIGSMSARAYSEVLSVLDEAEKLTADEKYTVRDFIKILRSGFTAKQVSLIPPKQDAVFVGDLSACVNAGTKVLLVGGLTGAVPSSSQDTAILTDGELTSLERLKLAVSPKISQVNLRIKEIVALNICAFSHKLYLTYPVKSSGDEGGASEIFSYAKKLFKVDNKAIEIVAFSDLSLSEEYYAYFNCRSAPALRRVARYVAEPFGDKERIAAVNQSLKERGYSALNSLPSKKQALDNISELYGGVVSPTELETYFSCPYRAFAEKGLGLSQRREEALRPLDTGNFIHKVLQKVAEKLLCGGFKDKDECESFARGVAEELSKRSEYSSTDADNKAEYITNSLIDDAVTFSLAVYDQINNSKFTVKEVEVERTEDLGGIKLDYKVDRIDYAEVDGETFVRVIDYKTGTIDDKAYDYYMGLKLQPPLYLKLSSEKKRPVGAYYFPANTDYSKDPNKFDMIGYMDASRDVLEASDKVFDGKSACRYIGKSASSRADKYMFSEQFVDFVNYSKLVAKKGAEEMVNGEIAPLPIEDDCKYCPMKGCCGYDTEKDGVREKKKADCKTIAQIARANKGGNN